MNRPMQWMERGRQNKHLQNRSNKAENKQIMYYAGGDLLEVLKPTKTFVAKLPFFIFKQHKNIDGPHNTSTIHTVQTQREKVSRLIHRSITEQRVNKYAVDLPLMIYGSS